VTFAGCLSVPLTGIGGEYREGTSGKETVMASAPVQDKTERDRLINEAAKEFPEYSYLDRVQERIYEEARERGPNMSYPEYEGPGFTEPAANDPGLHEDHPEYERDHYWDEDGNPGNDRDSDAGQYEDEPPIELALPLDRAVEESIPGGPERDARIADRDAGTLKTLDDRAAESDAQQFERYYGEPPTPAVDREAGS
jgi:hypothetical protein